MYRNSRFVTPAFRAKNPFKLHPAMNNPNAMLQSSLMYSQLQAQAQYNAAINDQLAGQVGNPMNLLPMGLSGIGASGFFSGLLGGMGL